MSLFLLFFFFFLRNNCLFNYFFHFWEPLFHNRSLILFLLLRKQTSFHQSMHPGIKLLLLFLFLTLTLPFLLLNNPLPFPLDFSLTIFLFLLLLYFLHIVIIVFLPLPQLPLPQHPKPLLNLPLLLLRKPLILLLLHKHIIQQILRINQCMSFIQILYIIQSLHKLHLPLGIIGSGLKEFHAISLFLLFTHFFHQFLGLLSVFYGLVVSSAALFHDVVVVFRVGFETDVVVTVRAF